MKAEIRRVRLQNRLLGQELAKRMGVSAARISMLERDEQRGAVTLKMMTRAAEALGCEFVYVLVPAGKSQAAVVGSVKPRLKIKMEDTGASIDSRARRLLNTTKGD